MDEPGTFTVLTLVDGAQADRQQAKTVSDLKANGWGSCAVRTEPSSRTTPERLLMTNWLSALTAPEVTSWL